MSELLWSDERINGRAQEQFFDPLDAIVATTLMADVRDDYEKRVAELERLIKNRGLAVAIALERITELEAQLDTAIKHIDWRELQLAELQDKCTGLEQRISALPLSIKQDIADVLSSLIEIGIIDPDESDTVVDRIGGWISQQPGAIESRRPDWLDLKTRITELEAQLKRYEGEL